MITQIHTTHTTLVAPTAKSKSQISKKSDPCPLCVMPEQPVSTSQAFAGSNSPGV